MNETEIICLLNKEVSKITKTGKAPAKKSLPKWLIYLDHQFGRSLQVSLTAAAVVRKRTRVFHAAYNIQTRRYTCHIDGVEY